MSNVYTEIVQTANTGLQFFEKCLDYAGYVPIISTFSGGVRIFLGKVEIITGIGLAAIFLVASLKSQENKKFYRQEAKKSFDYVIHGIANILRGSIECIRWVNLICLVFDHFVKKEKEQLRLCYQPPINFVANLYRLSHYIVGS